MKCRKCKKEMEIEETDIVSVAFDGVTRIWGCVCGERCQEIYDFEHITPTDKFWESDFK